MSEKNKILSKASKIPCDDLDRILGGTGGIITLFRAECGKCGFSIGPQEAPVKQTRCPECAEERQGLIRYAYISGEWIRIEP